MFHSVKIVLTAFAHNQKLKTCRNRQAPQVLAFHNVNKCKVTAALFVDEFLGVLSSCVTQNKTPSSAINIHIRYLPAGRSVLGKTVPEVLSTARGRRPRAVLKTEGTVFPNTDRPRAQISQYGPTKGTNFFPRADRLSPVNNMLFFPCGKLALQITNRFVYTALVIQWACAPSTNDL